MSMRSLWVAWPPVEVVGFGVSWLSLAIASLGTVCFNVNKVACFNVNLPELSNKPNYYAYTLSHPATFGTSA